MRQSRTQPAKALSAPGVVLSLLLSLLIIISISNNSVASALGTTTPPHPQPATQQPQQPRCPDPTATTTATTTTTSTSGNGAPARPRFPFPASFWLVKTIKTGGTTLASVLRHVCAHYGVVPVRKRHVNPIEQMQDAQAAAALGALVSAARNATDSAHFAIITHLNFSDAKLAAFQRALPDDGGRPLLFTAVRHPLARTYSHFIQAKCANAAAMLGGKIIECDRNETFMNRLLELDDVRNRWSFVRVPSRHNLMYNYVRGNATSPEAALAKYDFVFVSERMDEALVLFMLEFGLRLQDIAYLPSKVRTGKYKPAESMPEELNSYVLTANDKDLLLWQHANTLLDERRAKLEAQCGAGVVTAALASFQALQAAVAQQCADFKAWYAAHDLPPQYTYVNDEGWGWRCVRHVAQMYMEGRYDAQPPAASTEAAATADESASIVQAESAAVTVAT